MVRFLWVSGLAQFRSIFHSAFGIWPFAFPIFGPDNPSPAVKNVSRHAAEKKTPRPSALPRERDSEPRQLSLPFRQWGEALRSPQARIGFGVLTMLLAVGLALAFTSYLFSGEADQSVVGSAFKTRLHESGREVRNWLGLTGALIAHLLVFRWFGVAAFCFVPVLLATGFQMTFKRPLANLDRLSRQMLFTPD